MHTIFHSCPKDQGIRAIAMTHDAKYLATISDAEIQVQGPVGWPPRAGSPVQHVPGSRLLGPRGICASLRGPPDSRPLARGSVLAALLAVLSYSSDGATAAGVASGATFGNLPSHLLASTESLHLEVDFGSRNAGVFSGPSQRVRFSGEFNPGMGRAA